MPNRRQGRYIRRSHSDVRRRYRKQAPARVMTPHRRALLALAVALLCWALAAYMYVSIATLDFGTKFVTLMGALLLLQAGLLAMAGGKGRVSWAAQGLSQLGEALLFLFVVLFAAGQMLIAGGARTQEAASADYLVVMGAGLRGEQPSATLRLRLDRALAYLESNPSTVAILSGGQGAGEVISEASAMKRYLIARGVNAARLIEENRSRSTLENVRFSKMIMDTRDAEYTVAAVSNHFHLYRIRRLFALEGVQARTVGAPLPNPGVAVSMYIREFFSVANMWLGHPLRAYS